MTIKTHGLHTKTFATEAEAKEKWCPFTRVVGPNRMAPENRISLSAADHDKLSLSSHPPRKFPAGTHCLASQCMAWRWASKFYEEQDALGHCGLAGEP
jgi:hypothetical protein